VKASVPRVERTGSGLDDEKSFAGYRQVKRIAGCCQAAGSHIHPADAEHAKAVGSGIDRIRGYRSPACHQRPKRRLLSQIIGGAWTGN